MHGEVHFISVCIKRALLLDLPSLFSLSSCPHSFLRLNHLIFSVEMKLISFLAFTAGPLVSLAAPIAYPQAPQASSSPAPGFTVGRELTSSDLERCRLPNGAMNETCAAVLWRKFNDIEGQLQELQYMLELDDVSDEEYSTLVAELENPELVRTNISFQKTRDRISMI